MSEYHRLDFDKLHFAETPVSYGEAVKDAVPFEVPDDVVSRKRERELLGYAKEWQPIFVTTLCFRLFLLPDKRIRHKSYPYPLRIHIFCSNF